MVTRVVRQYSNSAVKAASKTVGKSRGTEAEQLHAREILSNFRSAHAFPLNAVTVNARKQALSINPNVVVAQRLKRLPTVLDKLVRQPNMSITTMQDLGGCRAVLDSIEEVDQMVALLADQKRAKNRIIRIYNYLHTEPGPKASGYRGVHIAYEYLASKTEYHGLKIELQVRTQLQHAWATAVETMDLFSGSELKYGKGDPRLIRFFAIVSSLMASAELTAQVPGAEAGDSALTRELWTLESDLGVVTRLRGYASVVNQHATSNRRNALTLELQRSTGRLNVTVHETMAAAQDRLTWLESMNDEDLDAVLVNISRIGQLSLAYPNYYADTTVFTTFVESRLAEVLFPDNLEP